MLFSQDGELIVVFGSHSASMHFYPKHLLGKGGKRKRKQALFLAASAGIFIRGLCIWGAAC